MGISFSPTRNDVPRWRELRLAAKALNDRIVQTVPQQAIQEIGEVIGIRRNGVLVFESEDMASVLMDSCLYDWFQDGKNLVRRYAEAHPAAPGTVESFLLDAYLQAKYRVLVTDSAVQGAGVCCRGFLNGGELFVMDLGLSQSVAGGRVAVATRTIPVGEYWITTGAPLAVVADNVEHELRRIRRANHGSLQGGGGPLTFIRACLAAGAAECTAYGPVNSKPQKGPRTPRWPGSRRHRH